MRKEMSEREGGSERGQGLREDKGQMAGRQKEGEGGEAIAVKWAACYTLHNNDVCNRARTAGLESTPH